MSTKNKLILYLIYLQYAYIVIWYEFHIFLATVDKRLYSEFF